MKKWRSWLTSLLLVTVIVAGCSNQSNNNANNGQNASNAGQENSANTDSNLNTTGLPIVNEPITLKVAVVKSNLSKVDIAQKEVIKDLESKTNIKVEWQEIPEDVAQEKVNLMLASGDLPDVLIGLVQEDQLAANYESGMFLALNDLLPQWAPNIQAYLDEIPEINEYFTFPDGNVYVGPAGAMSPWLYYYNLMYLNRDWLDRLDLDMPTTLEEYYQVLKAFKEQDANGNGDPNDEIPLSLVSDTTNSNMLYFTGMFGIPMDAKKFITIQDGKAVFAPATSNYRQFLEYFHRLYSEGLLDPESFAQDFNQLAAKGKNESASLLGSFIYFTPINVVPTERVEQYELLLPMEGPEGHQYYQMDNTIPGVSIGGGFVITKSNPYPEATLRWLDEMNADAFRKNEIRQGFAEQGVWSINEEGKIVESGQVPEGMTKGEWWMSIGWGPSAPVLVTSEDKEKMVIGSIAATKLSYDEQYKEFAPKDVLPNMVLPTDLQTKISQYATDLMNLVPNYTANAIIKGVTDESWNQFLQDLEKANYKEYEELYQRVYDLKN